MCLYVRPLSPEEGQMLLRLVRRSPNVTTSRRAQVILASAQGMPVSEIATLYHFNDQYVRTIIRSFNDQGMEAVKRKKPPGRPKTITEEERAAIVELALIPPRVLGLPFTQWSIAKLTEEIRRRKIVKEISEEAVRLILHEQGVSYQRTKTWKESNDPEFDSKKTDQRTLQLSA